jgi:hypothetical protein
MAAKNRHPRGVRMSDVDLIKLDDYFGGRSRHLPGDHHAPSALVMTDGPLISSQKTVVRAKPIKFENDATDKTVAFLQHKSHPINTNY